MKTENDNNKRNDLLNECFGTGTSCYDNRLITTTGSLFFTY